MRSGDIVGAINIAILSVWIAIKEMLSLGLMFRISTEIDHEFDTSIHCWSPGVRRDRIGMLPYQ